MSAIKIAPPNGVANQGKHYYLLPKGIVFEIDTKYELKELLGKGTFGTVCSAVNTETNEKVAVKKIDPLDGGRVPWRKLLRELTLLRQIEHPFVVRIKDVMVPSESEHTFTTIYVVFELVRSDLSKLAKRVGPMDNYYAKIIMNQLLRVIKYLHDGNVVHRDLKPSNILMGPFTRVKLCDFGLSRAIPAPGLPLSRAHGSVRYMAPEVLLLSGNYTTAIDIWSAGCIFAKLLRGRPLFLGKTFRDQLIQISNVIPKAKPEDLAFLEHDSCRAFLNILPTPTTSLREKLGNVDPLALDLLEKMLVFDPAKRLTAEEALAHPYMADVTINILTDRLKLNPSEVDYLNNGALQLEFDGEEYSNLTLSDEQGRAKTYTEILFYHRSENNDDDSSSSEDSP